MASWLMRRWCGVGCVSLSLIGSVGFSPSWAASNCVESLSPTSPNSRFELDQQQGTVMDRETGLAWQRCVVGMRWNGQTCQGQASLMSWQQALNIGYGDWRLPNVKELASLLELRCVNPAINEGVFPHTPIGAGFWSASPSAANPRLAWRVLFNFGHQGTYLRTGAQAVRLVKTDA